MALSAGCHIEIRNGGSDTICSGAFDPTQTAGMFTDGAATSANTSAPVFSSASYNFVAGDVAAYLFIGAGTNWTKGWYKIASVASNVATLTATAAGYQPYSDGVNTSAGCASVASPTGATWSIDYSQQDAAEIAYTDLSAAGAGSTFTSAGFPFTKAVVGNAVRVTGGTNCTTGHHVITSVAAGVATFNNAVTTGVTSDGAGRLGGALATPGYAGAAHISANMIWVKYHATAYTIASTTSNIATGRLTLTAGTVGASTRLRGYNATRGDEDGSRPTYKWGLNGGSTFAITGGNFITTENIIVDGDYPTRTGVRGIATGTPSLIDNVKLVNCDSLPLSISNSSTISRFEMSGCRTTTSLSSNTGIEFVDCYFHDNNVAGLFTSTTSGVVFSRCIFDTNVGATLTTSGGGAFRFHNCCFYNITGAGVDHTSAPGIAIYDGCIFDSNSTYGIGTAAVYNSIYMRGCAFYNNTSGKYTNTPPFENIRSEIVPTASPFVDAANGDFRLNMKTGGGASLRGASSPQTFPGLTWANRRDIGAHQHSGSSRGING